MIENAKSPFLLRVVICWQHGSEQDIQSFEANGFELTHTATEEGTTVHFLRIHGANIELIDIDYIHSKGCGWARNLAQRRRGEHYNLQIDSHHRFSGEWDFKMKSLLERLRVHSPRPLLTGYPPASILTPILWEAGAHRHHLRLVLTNRSRQISICPSPAPVHGEIAFKAKFVAGGFIFSDGAFTQEVMSDPDHFFCTEEIATSIRAFTKGYEFYHPYAAAVASVHNHARKVWDDQSEPPAANSATSMTLEDRSSAALRKTLALVGLPTGSEMEDFGILDWAHSAHCVSTSDTRDQLSTSSSSQAITYCARASPLVRDH